MRDSRFAIICVVFGILACAMIATYYAFFAPPLPSSPLLTRLPTSTAGTSQPNLLPTQSAPPPVQVPLDKTAGSSDANASEVGYKDKFSEADAAAAATAEKATTARDTLPPSRLAPHMFAFSSLPFDAPSAEFPLVQVGQRNLEWERATREPMGETAADRNAALSGRLPPEPPTPPLVINVPVGGGGNRGNQGISTNRPPFPPPEISTSGL